MAVRPVNVVYQEYLQNQGSVPESDLDTLIVGPCYHVKEFKEGDDSNKLSASYGTRRDWTNSPTAISSDEYPGNISGANVDADSVEFVMDPCDIILTKSSVGTSTTSGSSRLVCTSSEFAPLINGVEAGDYVVTSANESRRIRSLVHAFKASWNLNNIRIGHKLVISNDILGRDGTYTVIGLDVSEGLIFLNETQSSDNAGSANADYAFYDENNSQIATGSLEITSLITLVVDTPFDQDLVNGGLKVLKTLNQVSLPASYYEADSDGFTIDEGITVTYNGNSYEVDYAEIYAVYRALRTDKNKIVRITPSDISSDGTEIEGLGLISIKNPLALAVYIALQNTTTGVYAFGVISDDAAGHLDAMERISGNKRVYTIVPLTEELDIIASWKNNCNSLADPQSALSTGVPQKFRQVVAAIPHKMENVLYDKSSNGQVSKLEGSAPVVTRTLSFTGNTDFVSGGVYPGCKITIHDAGSGDYTYTIAHVNSATQIETDEDVAAAFSGGVTLKAANGDSVTVEDPTGNVIYSIDLSSDCTVTSSANDDLYLILVDNLASFVDSGVTNGDIIQIPKDPNDSNTSFSDVYEFEVDEVIDNYTLKIKNNGNNTSLYTRELPHGVTREPDEAGSVSTINESAIVFRVIRKFTKADLVSYVKNAVESIKDKRCVLVYPGRVTVMNQSRQPGYYLAAAFGGLMASVPPHQPLNYIGLAGIDELEYSNDYLSENQLTEMSNYGACVFVQEEGGLPYCIHQITTKYDTIWESEISHVRTFDYVSIRFQAVLESVKGVYTINPATLGYVKMQIKNERSRLLAKKYDKIGSVIIDAKVVKLEVADYSDDRLDLVINVTIPKVLNGIDIHVVAV